MTKSNIRLFFRYYFEIAAFFGGLLLLAMMDPSAINGPTLCLFERLGITFCPGHGLGHSISYIFHGDIYNALQANLLGPLALLIISGRIGYLCYKNHQHFKNKTYRLWPE